MTKADLHRIVDALSEDSVDAVGRWLERAAEDPVIAVLDGTPWDDEATSAEEEAAVQHARAEIARGDGIPWEQAKAELRAD